MPRGNHRFDTRLLIAESINLATQHAVYHELLRSTKCGLNLLTYGNEQRQFPARNTYTTIVLHRALENSMASEKKLHQQIMQLAFNQWCIFVHHF